MDACIKCPENALTQYQEPACQNAAGRATLASLSHFGYKREKRSAPHAAGVASALDRPPGVKTQERIVLAAGLLTWNIDPAVTAVNNLFFVVVCIISLNN